MQGEGETLLGGGQAGDFLGGHQRQLGAGGFGCEERPVFRQVGHGLEPSVAGGDQILEPGVFAGQFLGALVVVENLRIAQRGFDFGEAAAEFLDVRLEVHARKKESARRSDNSAGG